MAPEYSSKAVREGRRWNLLSGSPNSSALITPEKGGISHSSLRCHQAFPSAQQKHICFTSSGRRVQASSQHRTQTEAASGQESAKAGVTSAVRQSTYKDNLKEEYEWALGTQAGTADWRANSWTKPEAGGEKLCWLDPAVCRFVVLPVEFHYTLHSHKSRSQRHLILYPQGLRCKCPRAQGTCHILITAHTELGAHLWNPSIPVRKSLRVQTYTFKTLRKDWD